MPVHLSKIVPSPGVPQGQINLSLALMFSEGKLSPTVGLDIIFSFFYDIFVN